MINQSDIALCSVAHGVGWTADRVRDAYVWFQEMFQEIGLGPDRLSGRGGGMPGKYVAFEKGNKRAQNADFAAVESLAIVKMGAGGESELSEWIFELAIHCARKWDDARLLANPARINGGRKAVEDASLRFLLNCAPKYGYCFRQEMRFGPAAYAIGVGYGHVMNERLRDHEMNISWWTYEYPKPVAAGLLRDVYIANYLSAGHLNVPIGKSSQTLREWIVSDPYRRGALEPVVDGLLEWKPPPDQIPRLREELYRAGRLFYWRFFNQKDPLYRPDPAAPWEASGETPEVYRASFYEGRQPDLIY